MLKKLGWNPQPEMLSLLCRLLREHHGVERFLPAPVRVGGINRGHIYKLLDMMDLRKGAEVGVAGGENAAEILDTIEGCELLCVDHWGTSWSKKLEGRARRRLGDYAGATIVKARSVEAAQQVEDGSLDFVYIDAAHDWDNVMLDLILWNRKVKAGGVIAGHDYDRGHKKGVVPAVDEFTRRHQIFEWFLTDQKREASFFWMKP